MKIEINEEENKKFQKIACLADSPLFLTELTKLRKKLNLPRRFILPSDFDTYVDVRVYYRRDPEEEEHINLLVDEKEILESRGSYSNSQQRLSDIETELAIHIDPKKEFYFQVRKIKDLFGLSEEYMLLIAKAVVCGEVSGDDLNVSFTGKNPRQIKVHREWYWLNKKVAGRKRMGLRKLAREYKVTESTIKTAIERYESNLYRVTQ